LPGLYETILETAGLPQYCQIPGSTCFSSAQQLDLLNHSGCSIKAALSDTPLDRIKLCGNTASPQILLPPKRVNVRLYNYKINVIGVL